MTRTHLPRRWPWLALVALAVAAPAFAQEPLTIDILDPELDLELLESLAVAEAVALENELSVPQDQRPVEFDDWFWSLDGSFEATVLYDGEPAELQTVELLEAELLDLDTVFEDELAVAEALEDFAFLNFMEQLAYLLSDTIDADGDGWPNGMEFLEKGTDPFDRDTDDDGWADGPTNFRYQLRLVSMSRSDDHPWYKCAWCDGADDIYFVVDDARWPQASSSYGNGAINGDWQLPDESTITPNVIVQERIRTPAGPTRMLSQISIWDDDTDLGYHDDWYEDDHYFSFQIDLMKAPPGHPITVQLSNSCADFTVVFVVETSAFVDPNPLDYGFWDSDSDGLTDADEAFLARVFHGMADPLTEDIWVEVDRASDVGWWHDQARYMVVSQFRRHDINLRIDDGLFGGGTAISHTGTLSEQQWWDRYGSDFTSWRKGLFRYALLVDELWTGRSGIAGGDTFVVDADRYWFDVWTLTQAGTFMHELGHTLALTTARFPGSYIDTTSANPNTHYYYSCMNYWYQYRLVDYSEGDDPGQGDLDDWGNLDLGSGLPGGWPLLAWTL